jgi:hypothetical protein
MAIGSFKLEKLSILHVPFLFMARHGSRKALLKAKLVDGLFGINNKEESDCSKPGLAMHNTLA